MSENPTFHGQLKQIVPISPPLHAAIAASDSISRHTSHMQMLKKKCHFHNDDGVHMIKLGDGDIHNYELKDDMEDDAHYYS